MPCCYLLVRLANLSQHSFLIRDIGFNGIRNQEIRTASGSLSQLRQPLFCLRLKTHAKRSASCIRHEHIMARYAYSNTTTFARLPTRRVNLVFALRTY